MSASQIKPGDVFTVTYPFRRTEYEDMGSEGIETVQSWKPGVEYVPCGPYGEDSTGECHAEGKMVLTVVDTFKPGKYPMRVFFTRQWIDPDGKQFGKSNLRIMVAPAFLRRAKGWMAEPYEIVTPAPASRFGDEGEG